MERVLPGIGRHEALVAGEFGLRAPGARPRWRDARAMARRGRRRRVAAKRRFCDGSSVVGTFVADSSTSSAASARWCAMVAAGRAGAAAHQGALARPLPFPVGRRDRFLRASSRRTHSPSRECLEATLAGLNCSVWRRVRRGVHRRRVRPAPRCPTGPGVTAPDVASSAATRRAPADPPPLSASLERGRPHRRPVPLCVRRGPCRPPLVIDHERRLMLSRTPGRMRKPLRNVSGMGCPPVTVTPGGPGSTPGTPQEAGHDQPAPMY